MAGNTSVACELRDGFTICPVPGDGDCLFHAVHREVARIHGISFARTGEGEGVAVAGGTRLRSLLLRYVGKKGDEVIDGVRVSEWIQCCGYSSVEQYCERMRSPGPRSSWGGFLEIVMLCHVFREKYPMQVAVLDISGGTAKVYAVCGIPSAPRAAVAWSGGHWEAASLTDAAWSSIDEWRGRR